MSKKAKIIIALLILIAIIIAAIGIYKDKTREEEIPIREKDFSDMVEVYSDESKKAEDKKEAEDSEKEKENTTNEKSNKENVVGKEEKESAEENKEKSEDEVAVELAQKEWGLSTNSYNFITEKTGDGIYEVSVRNKNSGIEVTRYTVNVKTGAVEEAK